MLFVFIEIESSVLFVGLLYISFMVDCEYRKEPDRSACFFTSGHERNTTLSVLIFACTPFLCGLIVSVLQFVFSHAGCNSCLSFLISACLHIIDLYYG